MRKNYLILTFLLFCFNAFAQTVSINDATLGLTSNTFQESPIDPDDNYSYSQNIYLQSEINQAGDISKITFYTNGPLENSNNIVVYMAETSEDVFATNASWLPLESLTQVFSGTFVTYNNEVSLILDTPFNYSNTANLVIVVDENQEGKDSFDFINHDLNSDAAKGRVLHYGNNTNNPDPADPPAGILDDNRANIEIDFTAITCYPPKAVVLSNPSSVSIDAAWTSTASTWNYVVQEEGTGNPDAATSVEATSNIITVSGLTSNTAYEFYVRSSCGSDGNSSWVGPTVFRTTCDVVDDFSENFDALPTDLEVPYCWSTIASSTGTEPVFKVKSSETQSYSPSNYYEIGISADDNLLLISPESNIIADGMHRVEFAAKVNATDGTDVALKVGLMSNPDDENTFEELTSVALSSSSNDVNNYTLYYVNIPLHASAKYLAFKPETTQTYNKIIYLDDIVVTTQPSCFEALELAATNIMPTSFDLEITPDTQVQTEWEMVVVQTHLNFNPDLETPIVTNSLTNAITLDSKGNALIPNSPYRVFVRANCDATGSEGTGFSTWFGPYDTRTACAPLSANFSENFDSYEDGDFPFCWTKNVTSTGTPLVEVNNSTSYSNSPSNAIIFNTGNDPLAEVLLVMPQNTIVNDGAHRLEFYAKKSNANIDASLIIGTMSDPLDASTFKEITAVPVITGGGSSVEFVQYAVNLPASTNEYVVFKHSAGAASSVAIYIDDVSITDQPACTEVYNIIAENITANSVDVSWEFVGTQSNWEYVVQEAETGEPTTGTATTINVGNADYTSLASNTTYEIYVKSICNEDSASPWIGPITFTTACTPETGDYSYGFEGYNNNEEIVPCWSSLITPESTSPYVRYSTFQAAEGGSVSVKLYSGNDVTAGVYLITPMLTDFDATKQIKFQVYDDNNGALEVGTMTDPTDASTFTSYVTFLDEDMTDNAWDEKLITFDAYTGTDKYIVFKYNAATTFDSLYLDDFVYESNPALSVGDLEFSSTIGIYPNPVENTLHVSGQAIESLDVYTINGKRIMSEKTHLDNINVSTLPSGMYFISIKNTKGEKAVKKFVKK
ncbi:choice-of-anchor J domain-containing protein [Formosa sp. 4Alg 33]|uniref:choice-of-anchor J domain-containing protein n=1 Tax=Formosa sp. 4Alg 33 TaxID=3382189 RepID=UPI003D9C04D7